MIKVFNLTIQGRVQGVGYRSWAVKTANRIGVKGWVKNLYTGEVEVLIKGSDVQIEEMIKACRSGPLFARVDNVIVQEYKNKNPDDIKNTFEIV